MMNPNVVFVGNKGMERNEKNEREIVEVGLKIWGKEVSANFFMIRIAKKMDIMKNEKFLLILESLSYKSLETE